MLQDFGDPALARPVLRDPAAAQLRFQKRHPLYRRLANLTIDTTDQTPAQTVETILKTTLEQN
jgi:shikimate kinase